MKRIISVFVALVMLVTFASFASAAETWEGVNGTWVQSGSNMVAAAGSEADYWKLASTTSEVPADFTITGQIMVSSGGYGGSGTFFVLRDQGATVVSEEHVVTFDGIGFNFNFGHVRIVSGTTVLSTEGALGEWIVNVYAEGTSVQYIDFSVTLDGNKITALSFAGVDVDAEQYDYITLPVLAAGDISVGSYISNPALEMGIKNVVISTGDETPVATATPVPQETQAPGDFSSAALLAIPAMISLGAIVYGKKK